MGKLSRKIAHKAKVTQQQHHKKPKAVKTNLKRLNERVRDSVQQSNKLYEDQSKKQEPVVETTKQDHPSVPPATGTK